MISRIKHTIRSTALAAGLAAVAIGSTVLPANAEPPTHVMSVVRDITATAPNLAECPNPAIAALSLVFTESYHLEYTDSTFHLADNEEGTFTELSPSGEVLGSGHFTFPYVVQGPGAPIQTFTSIINATGKTVDGALIRVRIAQHFTITANGDVTSNFSTVTCS